MIILHVRRRQSGHCEQSLIVDDHSVFNFFDARWNYLRVLQSYAWGASVQSRSSETRAPRFSLQRRVFSYSVALLVTAPRF